MIFDNNIILNVSLQRNIIPEMLKSVIEIENHPIPVPGQ